MTFGKGLRFSERNSMGTHLWDRVRCHEPEHVHLYPPVQFNQRLQLGGIESAGLLQLDTTLEFLAGKASHHFVQVGRELVAQSMVDIQFTLT